MNVQNNDASVQLKNVLHKQNKTRATCDSNNNIHQQEYSFEQNKNNKDLLKLENKENSSNISPKVIIKTSLNHEQNIPVFPKTETKSIKEINKLNEINEKNKNDQNHNNKNNKLDESEDIIDLKSIDPNESIMETVIKNFEQVRLKRKNKLKQMLSRDYLEVPSVDADSKRDSLFKANR
jgi:hypothetical protein